MSDISTTITICLQLILNIIIGTFDMSYAVKYYGNDQECNHSETGINPDNWLYVHGVVEIIASIVIILVAICGSIKDSISIAWAPILLNGFFSLAWTIVGAVVLWRDNLDCHPHDLYNYMMASVIIKLVFIGIGYCLPKSSKNDISNSQKY